MAPPEGPNDRRETDSTFADRGSPFAACTIVSKNYLSLARLWSASVQKHHPGARTFVLIVDRIDGAFDPAGESFEVIEVESLGIPDFPDLAFKYNILELNTAVKPFFLEYLFQRKSLERIVYFDPDTVLFGPIDLALGMLEDNDIVVVPHILFPQKRDGRRPDETDFLISGAYNLGFLALRKTEETFSFLRWWKERLTDLCFSAPERGLFTDQKWIDLVPSVFSRVGILKDRGYNVAYWNIHERMDLAERDGVFGFPECPLTFFHFSGIDFDNPRRISRYQNRFRFSSLPEAYRKLFSRYVEENCSAGFHEIRRFPYAFGEFDDGVGIPPYLRMLYAGQGTDRRRWEDPFSTGGEDSFRDWLLAPNEFGSEIPRLLHSIYESRGDVRDQIPNGERQNAKRLLAWAIARTPSEYKLGKFFIRHFQDILDGIEAKEARARIARAELESRPDPYFGEPQGWDKRALQQILSPTLYRQVRKQAWTVRGKLRGAPATVEIGAESAPAFDPALPRGVNLFGYFDTESGVGEIARSMASMLRDAGISHNLINLGQHWLRRNDRRFRRFATTNPYAMNLFMVNADQVPHLLGRIGGEAVRGRINVGYWFWEISTFPRCYEVSFEPFDEIWVASEFCREAISASSPIPVVRVPPGFEFESPRGELSRASVGIKPNEFVFLYVFDVASSVSRKNPAGLIRAFRSAFPNPSAVRLILKIINSTPRRLSALERLTRGIPVEILSEYLDRSEMFDLLDAADCYVSLHRSEGLGLTLLESMALGKPVIATGYSGNADFLHADVGFPVGYELVSLKRTIGPYEKGAVWAEPDLEEAARWMRFVRENPAEAARVGAAAREKIRGTWSIAASIARLRERIDMLVPDRDVGAVRRSCP
ncbi:MAG: glycosyltransferase family 4 protein [Thermoanaerobaculia bacterium]